MSLRLDVGLCIQTHIKIPSNSSRLVEIESYLLFPGTAVGKYAVFVFKCVSKSHIMIKT